MTAHQKVKYIRSKVLRESAHGSPCFVNSEVCNHNPETTVLAHSNWHEDGKGAGIKAHDIYATFACSACHDWIDNRLNTGQTEIERRDAFHTGMKMTWLVWIMADFIEITVRDIKK